MRAYDTVTTNATTITLAPAASANIETKTDLQTQRDFLLKRHNEVRSSIDYGTLFRKMREAFNIDIDNTPKTARELIDGIKSGKYTLDEKAQAIQDIEIADGDDWASPLHAMNWGGLQPDRVGYAAAQSKFYDDLKAAKDTIMIGTPEAGLAAIQALEAWTPPATAAAN